LADKFLSAVNLTKANKSANLVEMMKKAPKMVLFLIFIFLRIILKNGFFCNTSLFEK